MAALAAGVAGCASPGSGIQPGEHVTVYVSMPLHGAEAADGRDIVDGAKLAIADAQGTSGELGVRAVYLDDTEGRGAKARWSPAAAAANARRAAGDSTAIAYVGEFDSGATRFSLPITNEARMLQVSPASSAIDLVQPYLGAGDQVPEDTQPTGQRTFGRVIPSDEAQAEAGAGWARRLGLRRVAVVSDGSPFGDTMASAFKGGGDALALAAPSPSAPEYYAGSASDAPAAVTRRLEAPCPRAATIGSDALLGSPLVGQVAAGGLACPAAAPGVPRGTYITSDAQDPSQLPASGERFLGAFRDRYRRLPGRYAAYGYEAMAVVLDSIRRAGDSGDDRDAVVDAFFGVRDRQSVLGSYSIDDVGNTTLGRLTGYRIARGRPTASAELRVP